MLSGWFGSDVYIAYTAKYTWQSNQMAHAMMGFAGTTLLAAGALSLGGSLLWALGFAAIPVSKDLTDLLLDRARASSVSGKTQAFPVNMRELAYDAATDLFFWSFGMMLSLAVMSRLPGGFPSWGSWLLLAITLAMFAAMFVPGRHYSREKTAFDRSGLPYFFRLPTFDGNFANSKDPSLIGTFVGSTARKAHLLIHGPPDARKTTLAVGIGCGMTITRQFGKDPAVVRYVSAAKLADELTVRSAPTSDSELHSVSDAKVLIVDDLPDVTLTTHQPPGPAAWCSLLQRPIVWVVADPKHVEGWQKWLNKHKPGTMTIHLIELQAVGPSPGTPQYSLLKGKWLGIFPLLGIAIPVSLGIAAVWAVICRSVPDYAALYFAGAGFVVAVAIEMAMCLLRR